MIVQIIFDFIAIGMFVGNLITGMKAFGLAIDLRSSNLRGEHWNGYVSIRKLKKLLPYAKNEDQKEKINKTIYYIRLSRIFTLTGFFLILILFMLNAEFGWKR